MPENVSDIELIRESLSGRASAFDVLVLRYQDRLVHSLEQAIGSREDALEIAQEAFVSAWKQLASFRFDAAFYSWLYRIAMNAYLSRKRRNRIHTSSLDTSLEESGQTPADHRCDSDPEQKMNSSEQIHVVRSALQMLAEEFRQAIVLKEIDGLSYEEISIIMNIPIGTVRSRIFRARRELTEQLERLFREQEHR